MSTITCLPSIEYRLFIRYLHKQNDFPLPTFMKKKMKKSDLYLITAKVFLDRSLVEFGGSAIGAADQSLFKFQSVALVRCLQSRSAAAGSRFFST